MTCADFFMFQQFKLYFQHLLTSAPEGSPYGYAWCSLSLTIGLAAL